MTSVREATFELLRSHGITRIFGNPGSTELGMLKDFPDDFSYVLGLQELVVVGMADGFAQASGTVGHANLHTAPGVGNAIGGIFNILLFIPAAFAGATNAYRQPDEGNTNATDRG